MKRSAQQVRGVGKDAGDDVGALHTPLQRGRDGGMRLVRPRKREEKEETVPCEKEGEWGEEVAAAGNDRAAAFCEQCRGL